MGPASLRSRALPCGLPFGVSGFGFVVFVCGLRPSRAFYPFPPIKQMLGQKHIVLTWRGCNETYYTNCLATKQITTRENYDTNYSTMENTTNNLANKRCWGVLADRVGCVEHAENRPEAVDRSPPQQHAHLRPQVRARRMADTVPIQSGSPFAASGVGSELWYSYFEDRIADCTLKLHTPISGRKSVQDDWRIRYRSNWDPRLLSQGWGLSFTSAVGSEPSGLGSELWYSYFEA